MTARSIRRMEQAGAAALLFGTLAMILFGALKAAWWAWGLLP